MTDNENNAVDEGARLDALDPPGHPAVRVRLADGTEEVFASRALQGGTAIYDHTVFVTGHLTIWLRWRGPEMVHYNEGYVAAVYAPGAWLRVTPSLRVRPDVIKAREHRLPT